MGNSRGFLVGFLVGALLGAAIAVMYAPQPGEETRRVVKEKASEVVERGRRVLKRKEGEKEEGTEEGGKKD
ncbi:MAG: YtxH domain-containing protein [Armatimonadota bacterium]